MISRIYWRWVLFFYSPPEEAVPPLKGAQARVYKSVKSKQGFAVQLAFTITQHSRDKELLNVIAQFLECGRVADRSNGGACDFIVNSIKDLKNKIIPFFNKYPLLGTKSLNYQDFVKVFELMDTKKHLTQDGLATIIKIKSGMNTGRIQLDT
uniref:LAGLIDADG endonuclease n=1 Tax=Cryphonectria parasitica TaxID=5116 RepID=A0A191MXG4_CRYPA|nr:LAGLIDADG endonuclease [Cryphonectria parasitica]